MYTVLIHLNRVCRYLLEVLDNLQRSMFHKLGVGALKDGSAMRNILCFTLNRP